MKLKQLTMPVVAMILLLTTFGCAEHYDEPFEPTQPSEIGTTCKVRMNLNRTDFDDAPKTRSAEAWEEGDKIFLTFTTSSGNVDGYAVYSNGEWVLTYYGTLPSGETSSCKAVYFSNPVSSSLSVAQVNICSGIYEDLNGVYTLQDGIVSLSAELSPKTGRMRFAGTPKDKIKIYGFTYAKSYDAARANYTYEDYAVTLTVNSDGYTPYIYGRFTNSDSPVVNLITANYGYTRKFSNQIFKPGDSGYLTIPTINSHSGWQEGVIVNILGAEFKLLPVTGAYSLLLGETEVTEEQYSVTVGSKQDSQFPKSGITYSDWETFVYNLNNVTKLGFTIPSKEEWAEAAKGGNKSRGYTYIGGNILDDVAWNTANAGNKKHIVKQLQPNELGFYDMAGNVNEFCLRYEDNYYTWISHYRGGSYRLSGYTPTSCKEYTNSSVPDMADIGFRLKLSVCQ